MRMRFVDDTLTLTFCNDDRLEASVGSGSESEAVGRSSSFEAAAAAAAAAVVVVEGAGLEAGHWAMVVQLPCLVDLGMTWCFDGRRKYVFEEISCP